MAHILIAYETFDGQTARIVDRMRLALLDAGHFVTVKRAARAAPELGAHDAVIVGGSVRYGRHAGALEAFVRENAGALSRLPGAFFTVCMAAARPDADKQAEAFGYGDALLHKTSWRPRTRAVFAGALLYRKYPFAMRMMMKLIARMAKGDTDTSRDHEYTDWVAVQRFAREFAATLERSRAAA